MKIPKTDVSLFNVLACNTLKENEKDNQYNKFLQTMAPFKNF